MPRGIGARDNTFKFLTRTYQVERIEVVGDKAVITLLSTARYGQTAFPAGASRIEQTVYLSQLTKLPQKGSIVDADLKLVVTR